MRLPDDASSPVHAPVMPAASLSADEDLDLLFDPSRIPQEVKSAYGSDVHVSRWSENFNNRSAH